MKPSTLPITCCFALTAMSTAGLSHWWSVRQVIAASHSGMHFAATSLSAPRPASIVDTISATISDANFDTISDTISAIISALTPAPTAAPSPALTAAPTPALTAAPTPALTAAPTPAPIPAPTLAPSDVRPVKDPVLLVREPVAQPPDPNAEQKKFFEALIEKINGLQNQNRDLLDQLAETNRDLMKLEFRVDTHSESFRPLPVSEDRPFTSVEVTPGVLPPRAIPVPPARE